MKRQEILHYGSFNMTWEIFVDCFDFDSRHLHFDGFADVFKDCTGYPVTCDMSPVTCDLAYIIMTAYVSSSVTFFDVTCLMF